MTVLGADGHGTSPLRKDLIFVFCKSSRLTGSRTTIEKDSLGREHMKLSFHVGSSTLSEIGSDINSAGCRSKDR